MIVLVNEEIGPKTPAVEQSMPDYPNLSGKKGTAFLLPIIESFAFQLTAS